MSRLRDLGASIRAAFTYPANTGLDLNASLTRLNEVLDEKIEYHRSLPLDEAAAALMKGKGA